ncbi:glycosyltransferase family 4 protein [Inquilinus sp. CAU 1745]|uniref:glycosyltransferase family 4 protein n=1 Tax=Inquilinus sp. CAU 1745 TaxID=3140369 RepID=UPI00325A9316
MTPNEIDAPTRRPKVVYLVTEDWYFWSHRLPMAEAARDAGFDVAVACRVNRHGDKIRSHGIDVHALDWTRRALGPFELLKSIRMVAALYRREKPDIVHHVAVKPVVIGAAAARLAHVPAILSGINGFGYSFSSRSLKAKVTLAILGHVLERLAGRPRDRVLLQNPDDRDFLVSELSVPKHKSCVILGSGIDTEHFNSSPEPEEGPFTIAVVSRMLAIKGIDVAVEAHRLLRRRGCNVVMLLAGGPDPHNPASFTDSQLNAWASEPGIEWLGHVDDVRTVWGRAHVAVQPSLGGEGLPKSLLEAAACGRPIIATDVPGCREIARADENALLVPPNAPGTLADAIEALYRDRHLRERFALASRRIVEKELSSKQVGDEVVALYAEMVGLAPVVREECR